MRESTPGLSSVPRGELRVLGSGMRTDCACRVFLMKTLSDLAFNGLASPTAAVQFNRSRRDAGSG